MDELIGNTLLFTDIHFGIKQNSINRLNICIKVVKHILESIKQNDVKNVIFAGDLFHERVSVNVNTLNVALKCINSIAKYCNVYLVVGNHDSHYKNSVEINSLNMFKNTANVKIVDKPEQISLNNQKVLLCPWLSEYASFKLEEFDILVGHFDIPTKFIMSQYIQDNSMMTHTSEYMSNQLSSDSLLESNQKNNTKEDIGTFVDLAKVGGTIFSGHIHKNREFIVKRRKFIFIGAPYEQNRGDIGNDCGFYILDSTNKHKFIKIDDTPKHIDLRVSKIVKEGIDKFNFGVVKGNIVHKIYDVEVDRVFDSKLTQKIIDFKPYEELIPDYEVDIDYGKDVKLQNETIQLIKKSKLEYIKNYIMNIDKTVLDEQTIDAEQLYKTLEEYYNKVIEEK